MTAPLMKMASGKKFEARMRVKRQSQQRFSASGVCLNPRFQGTPFAHRHVVARFIAATVY
jgi:hypothetical protein